MAVDISKTLASGTGGIGGKLFNLSSVETAAGSRGSTLVIKLKNAALADIKNSDERGEQTPFYNRLRPGVTK